MSDELKAINLLITRRDWKTLKALSLSGINEFDVAASLREPGIDLINHHYYLAISQYSLGEVKSSVESFRLATTLSPDSSIIWGSYGDALLAEFKCVDAKRAFERAWKLEKNEVSKRSLAKMETMYRQAKRS